MNTLLREGTLLHNVAHMCRGAPVCRNRCVTSEAEAQLQVHAAVHKASSTGQCARVGKRAHGNTLAETLHVYVHDL